MSFLTETIDREVNRGRQYNSDSVVQASVMATIIGRRVPYHLQYIRDGKPCPKPLFNPEPKEEE